MGLWTKIFRHRKRQHNPEPQEFMVGASRVRIGRFTYDHKNIAVRQWGEGANLQIGSFCSIAGGLCVMLGGNHRTDWITTFPFGHIFNDKLDGQGIKGHPATNGDVHIGNDVWIGSNVTIMSGITIGDGAVIAANSTVVKNVAPYEIWGGNPAKKIKDRFSDTVVDELLALRWWDLDVSQINKISALLSQEPSAENLVKIRKKIS